MDLSTVANGWVSSYLEALMSAGLSSEHVKTETPAVLPSPEGQRADRSVCAKYYVNQILNLDEEGIKGAWKRSTCGAGAPEQQSEKDARLAYLSWRVWGMKRKRSEVRAMVEAERQMSLVEEDEEEASLAQLTSFSLADLSQIVPNPLPVQQQSFSSRRNLEALLSHSSFSAQPPQEHRQPSRAHLPNPLVVEEEEDADSPSHFAAAPSWSSPTEAPGKAALTRVTDPIERIPRLYIVLISMHGLIRGQEMELGRDPDTGGQVKYVVELAKALGRMPSVLRVDLLTRKVDGPGIPACYAEPEEALMPNSDANGLGGSYIVRVPCGPPKTYLRKEELWPHVREFADWSIGYISDKLAQLQGEGGQPSAELHVVHGHYADAGETASLVAHTLGVDMVLTGHSLGRNKRDFLIKQGTMSRTEIEETYAMTRRIEGEERALDAAMQVITSTQEEIDKQWGLYDGYNGQLGSALRNRPCKGYHVPDTLVIPPGLDFSNLKVKLAIDPWELVLGPQKGGDASTAASPPARNSIGGGDSVSSAALRLGAPRDTVEAAAEVLKTASLEPSAKQRNASRDTLDQASSQPSFQAPPSRGSMSGGTGPHTGHQTPHGQAEPPIWTEISRFLRNPRKPAILTMCRADAKKNVTSLIHAYGQNKLLREISNLVLILGNRDTIEGLSSGSAQVMTQVLKLVDMYDLYGSVAYPKHHLQTDVSDIYLFAAATKGVFINPALQEPFGLTLIEAAAHGVPTVATKHGGPVDIVETLQNGLLVEPTNPTEIGECLVKIVTNPEIWDKYSSAGSTNIVAYSWPSHCMQYLRAIGEEKEKPVITPNANLRPSLSEEELTLNKLCDATIETRTLSMPASRHGDVGFPLLSPGAGGTPRGGGPSLKGSGGSGGGGFFRSPRGSSGGFQRQLSDVDDKNGPDGEKEVSQSQHTVEGAVVELMFTRAGGYIVYSADDEADLKQVAELLSKDADKAAAAVLGKAPSAAEPVGYGLMTTLTFKEVQAVLGPAANNGSDTAGGAMGNFDFVVCLAGAQVWHRRSDGAGWVCDTKYEELIDFRWEPSVAKQVVKRLSSGTTGWSKLPINKDGCPYLKVLPTGGPYNMQVLIPAAPEGGAASGKPLPPLDVELLLARLRCKLRKSGIRAQLLASAAPPHVEGGGGGALMLHITPLRCSRTLALRYLTHRYKVPMTACTLAVFYAKGAAGKKLEVASSDAADLMGGQQKVALLPGNKASANKPSAGGLHFKVDLTAFDGTGRIRVVDQL